MSEKKFDKMRLSKFEFILKTMDKLCSQNKNDSMKVELCDVKMDNLVKELNTTYEEIISVISNDYLNYTGHSHFTISRTLFPEWKFICIQLYCLHLFLEEYDSLFLISPEINQLLKKSVENMMDVGIRPYIQPNLPFHKPLGSVDIDVEQKYYLQRGSIQGLLCYSYYTRLRDLLFGCYPTLFVGLFQLSFSPLLKPGSKSKDGSFVMTEEFHNEVICGQSHCREILSTLREKMSLEQFLFNLSLIMKKSNPRWMVKATEDNLNYILKNEHGIKSLFHLMYGSKTEQYSSKTLEVLGEIICQSSKSEDFDSCILPQIKALLYYGDLDKGHTLLFGEVLKRIYIQNNEKGNLIIDLLLFPLSKLVQDSSISYIDRETLPKGLAGAIRAISYVFVNSVNTLPFELVKNYIGILFNIYMFSKDAEGCSLVADLQNILKEYFKQIDKSEGFKLLKYLIFNIQCSDYFMPRYNLYIETNRNVLKIQFEDKPNIKNSVLNSARDVLSLFNNESNLENLLFVFLLSCLAEPEKYFTDVSLLLSEDQGFLSTFEKKIAVFEILNLLASKDSLKKTFKEKIPEELMNFFNQIFTKAIETDAHNNPDHEDYETIFTIAIVLKEVSIEDGFNLDGTALSTTLKLLRDSTKSTELKELLIEIIKDRKCEQKTTEVNDELEENIQCALSERIEIQGHGLIALKKMIASKHPEAIQRKQFIFTIFKQGLANRDTYIYLAAINGIASFSDLGTECTNMVLNTLCEEYQGFPSDEFGSESTEMRLKIGEILVKITSKLGDMAPHYKSLLLNTFLCGTKDEDHLVRASSLSNLAEICKILGYKLGPIITEILMCLDGILSCDKHAEPRRASVFVIRQLIVGCDQHMLTVLDNDILVVYRTLKHLYNNDEDDVVKLHCELALQEITTNMGKILAPLLKGEKPYKTLLSKTLD